MSSRLPSWSSGTSGVRQRFSLTTIIVGSIVGITLILLLLSSIAHFYQAPDGNSVPEKALNAVPANHKQVLVLLPQDKNRQEGNYGFKGDWLEMATENRKSYADFHGYKFMWANLADYKEVFNVHPQWSKIAAVHDAFDKYPEVEWIWLLDSDAIIMNSTIGLWDYLLSPEALQREVKPEAEIKWGKMGPKKLHPLHDQTVKTPKIVDASNIYMVISQDNNGLNTGSFFIRRNGFMSAFIDFWHDPLLLDQKFKYNEQDGLTHLMLAHPHLVKHVGVVEQKKINSYPSDFKNGEFLVHFAGCRNSGQDCDKMFVEFWNRRTPIGPAERVPKLLMRA